MAIISAQISDELMDAVDDRSHQIYGRKNRSAYLLDLIKKDLEQFEQPVSKNDQNCFMNLAEEFVDTISQDKARDVIEKRNIKQSHFLAHIIIEASKALNRLEDNQSWENITCYYGNIDKELGTELNQLETILEMLKSQQEVKTKENVG